MTLFAVVARTCTKYWMSQGLKQAMPLKKRLAGDCALVSDEVSWFWEFRSRAKEPTQRWARAGHGKSRAVESGCFALTAATQPLLTPFLEPWFKMVQDMSNLGLAVTPATSVRLREGVCHQKRRERSCR